jgi:hypothetical protein
MERSIEGSTLLNLKRGFISKSESNSMIFMNIL